MEKVKKIDIHVHTAFKEYLDIFPKRPLDKTVYASPEQLIVMYEDAGIESGILLPGANPEGSLGSSTPEMSFLITQKYKGHFDWFMNIDPRKAGNDPKADLSYFIEHYKSLGAKGVGELCANLYLDDPRMDNLFYHCGQCDMPVLFHLAPEEGGYYGLIDEPGLPRLEKALKKYPNLKIIGHSQVFWAEISRMEPTSNRSSYPTGKVTEGRIAKLMRDYGNLYCDLSAGSGLNAMRRDKDYAAKFLGEFSDRVMFGTDICSPLNTHHIALSDFYDQMQEEKYISSQTYRKICRENAIRILKLDKN